MFATSVTGATQKNMSICDWTEMEVTLKWCEKKLLSSITDLGELDSVPSFVQAVCRIAH